MMDIDDFAGVGVQAGGRVRGKLKKVGYDEFMVLALGGGGLLLSFATWWINAWCTVRGIEIIFLHGETSPIFLWLVPFFITVVEVAAPGFMKQERELFYIFWAFLIIDIVSSASGAFGWLLVQSSLVGLLGYPGVFLLAILVGAFLGPVPEKLMRVFGRIFRYGLSKVK